VAAEQLSAVQLNRDRQLVAQGFISKDKLDASRTAQQRDAAHVAELRDQLKTAQLASREDQIRAQAAEVDAARAALAQSEWRLKQKSVAAAKAGLVFDTLYVEGEWVPAGSPVVSVLPPGNVKVRFFVPENAVGSLKPGQAVEVRCDGCGQPVSAFVSYISPQPEFTPPVIYSNETRAKLVFMIEARPGPEEGVRLRPGQPVEVTVK
jgi:HlyD family secretion protein